MYTSDDPALAHLVRELENFQDIASHLIPLPGEVPRLPGIDVWGGTRPLSGAVGGDHIIYVDFKQRFDLEARISRALSEGRTDIADNLRRCQNSAGIALIDVAGHRMTDALLAAMLHQAFLVGAIYELDIIGRSQAMLFKHLGGRVSVESLHADGEVIDQSWRVLLPQRHECTVDSCSACSQAQNLVGFILTDRHQTKDVAIEIR